MISIVVVIYILASHALAAHHIAIERSVASLKHKQVSRFPVHGNWCGPSHGGYNDCCGGSACPSCRTPRVGEFNYSMDPLCLKQCPPVDDTDLACAWHDTCYSISGSDPVCGGIYDQECFCNCVLTSVACQPAQPVTGICEYFSNQAACWVCDLQENKWECDTWDGAIDFPITHFCHDGPSILLNWPRTGEIDYNLTSSYPFCSNPNSTFSSLRVKAFS